jgi:hypothetical protein
MTSQVAMEELRDRGESRRYIIEKIGPPLLAHSVEPPPTTLSRQRQAHMCPSLRVVCNDIERPLS